MFIVTMFYAIYCTQDLSKRYRELRRTRGDGNCFFRAVAFAYLETLLENNADLPR